MAEKSKAPKILLALIILGAAVLLFFATRNASRPPASSAHGSSATLRQTDSAPAPDPVTAKPSAPMASGDRVQDLLAFLQAGATPEEARRRMQELREYLRGLPKADALRIVQQFLATHGDANAPLDFKLSPDGSLTEAPTLRVWMLDTLSQLDPLAAAELARGILNDSTGSSADEWAVALRDFARTRTSAEDHQYVEAKLRELFSRDAWRQQPSAGFLEAFDAIVYLKATSFTPDLAAMMTDKSRRDLPHAAFLTLDRLVLQEPAKVLGDLQAQPQLMAGREQTRANYFARADIRDAQQRGVLEQYLLDPQRSPQELETFAGLYPSGNYMVSNNLLTRTETPTQAQLAAKDRESLAVVEGWLSDPRFEKLQPQLRKIRDRLQTFVQQAATQ